MLCGKKETSFILAVEVIILALDWYFSCLALFVWGLVILESIILYNVVDGELYNLLGDLGNSPEKPTYKWKIDAIMIWKSFFSAVALLAHILTALAAPILDPALISQSQEKYVFAHFMVSILVPIYIWPPILT